MVVKVSQKYSTSHRDSDIVTTGLQIVTNVCVLVLETFVFYYICLSSSLKHSHLMTHLEHSFKCNNVPLE